MRRIAASVALVVTAWTMSVRAVEAQGCSYTLSPLSITVSGAGGSGQVSVTTSPGCAWTASTTTSWLSVSGTSGVGNGVVSWTATPNRLTTQRIGMLTIAGRTIFVAQSQPTTINSPPGVPRALTAAVSGRTVTFNWSAPDSGGTPSTYILAAGSASGWSDVASFPTGNAQTSFSAGNVPDGTYFVRVSAQNVAGTSAASNEVSFTVPQTCGDLPLPPSGVQSSVSGSIVTLSWGAPAGGVPPSAYAIEAGSAPSRADFGTFSTGSPATVFTAAAMPGTYYVRVRSLTVCGTSAPSEDVAVVVRP